MNDYSEIKALIEKFVPYGIKHVEKTGAILIGYAPFIAPEAWLNHLFPPLSPQQIYDLERSLNQPIPDEYKQFLMYFSNGLNVLNGKLSLFGLRNNYNRESIDDVRQPFDILIPNLYERPFNATPEMLFIGSYSWDGSQLYISKKGEVVFCSRDDAHPLKQWDSLNHMLISEIQRLYTLFDDSGKQLNKGLPTTPVFI